jgi:hypothetical protein
MTKIASIQSYFLVLVHIFSSLNLLIDVLDDYGTRS